MPELHKAVYKLHLLLFKQSLRQVLKGRTTVCRLSHLQEDELQSGS